MILLGHFCNFREIYSTLIGYAVLDGRIKGGHLIRSFTKVINHDLFFESLTLNEIIMQTKKLGIKSFIRF